MMRDEERIGMYYTFGTIDWYSEMAGIEADNKSRRPGGVYGAARFLKLAALLCALVLKNLSTVKRK